MFAIESSFFWLLAFLGWAACSEHPERECCSFPTVVQTTTSSLTTTSTERTGPNIKTTIAILNCLLARQLCFEDPSCSAILEIIPRVCGPELVACSTVTVTKCQAALRTLQAFPFFKPTCLCREPHVDPECNSFRDFLFDHPCVFVLKKEKDPYPVDALPTCNYALSVCQEERKCIKLFEDFKLHCKVRENKCRMDNRKLCQEAWANLHRSPMFGCICPNNNMKRKCDRIFSLVNHNPCIEYLPNSSVSELSRNSNNFHKIFWSPLLSLRPMFSFPSSTAQLPSHGTAKASGTKRTPYHQHSDSHETVEEKLGTTFDIPELDVQASESSSTSLGYGLGNAVLENPLVDADNGLEAHTSTDHITETVLSNKPKHNQVAVNSTIEEDLDNKHSPHHAHRKFTSSSNENFSEPGDVMKIIYQSTCHLALESCKSDYQCRMAIQPILTHCDISKCNRYSCMEALQAFYRKASFPWNLEVAFCLCKKTDDKHDACMIAQQKLHPLCAQRVEGSPQPTCLSLAESCRENRECRSRLEQYEQACAVDSSTKKCAGPPSECRAAMLGILGTELRATCACKGTDLTQLYECLGWQRLLWVNPCVVDSQKDYHLKKAIERGLLTSTATPLVTTTGRIRMEPLDQVTVISVTQASVQTKVHTTMENTLPPEIPSTITTTTTTTTTTHKPTTTTPTTTTTEATTIPPRFCVFQRHDFPDQYIKEGTSKRIYHEDESECSEICKCGRSEELVCKTMCIDRMPCRTEFAFYNHAAPAYQAYRGRCLCYSGRFICMKPAPGDYTLPQGVFLFLGYSEVDEQKLKNHTEIAVNDVVHALQEFITKEAVNGTLCSLHLYNVTQENVIIAGKLSPKVDYNLLSPKESLAKEKDECSELMETITDRINNRHPDFSSHILLSIFKMAEVELVQLEPSSACFPLRMQNNFLLFVVILQLLLFS
ncbi:uncharacterized protein LOC108741291 isoform X2 [Agrilus planipennis]|uniref:Uncharacterized protein LOC108741291 isoform X2 n=1 Tax=Agrilus planipennis TaxID=224129 RepID=A0A1W4XFJ4_AGRPL|nr:uncharacterized protein LOC108741291 isoform X2 [Agrilus planipennis]